MARERKTAVNKEAEDIKENTKAEGSKEVSEIDPSRFNIPAHGTKAAKTAQRSIPYIACYEDGMMQVEPKVFSVTYEFPDVNFKTLSPDEQDAFFDRFETFLNSIDTSWHVTFNILNILDDIDLRFSKVSLKERGNSLDKYRREMNDMILTKMKKTRGAIITKKYITYAIRENSVDAAVKTFNDIDISVIKEFRQFIKKEPHRLNLDERLELLAKIYGTDDSIYFQHDRDGNVTVDWASMKTMKMTTKDIIAPSALSFKNDKFLVGDQYAQAFYMAGVANRLSTDFIGNITDINAKMLLSIDITPLDSGDAVNIIKKKQITINSEIATSQKNAIKNGYSPDLLPQDLKTIKEQTDELMEDLQSRDQRMFYMQLNLTHFANDAEDLKRTGNEIKASATKNLCTFHNYSMQQERGFNSTLPLGVNHTYTKRLLTTEALAAFMPFTEVSTFEENGFYYGMNAINKSVIILDRLRGQNYNGLILGAPGSGKSFSAKREMVNTILNTDNEVYIIDPDGEYSPIVKAFGGAEIKIAPGNGLYLNPFDLDLDTTYDKENNPMVMQADFITGLLETMVSNGRVAYAGLSAGQAAAANRCINKVYEGYVRHIATLEPGPDGRRPTIDRNAAPTLQDLWDMLLKQQEPEAQEMALYMEPYATGNYDTFAHRTNVDINNRLTVFNIKNIGNNLKELGLKICLNMIWNKVVENRVKGKWTWIYIDEFHLLLATPTSAEFIQTIWKRARKFQGVPTGITQNTEDLLKSPAARGIINNTNFVQMLNQSMLDRQALMQLLHLSENEMQYITNVDSGRGLIHIGGATIPFVDKFPMDTDLYKIMSTKPNEEV